MSERRQLLLYEPMKLKCGGTCIGTCNAARLGPDHAHKMSCHASRCINIGSARAKECYQ